MEGHRGRPYCVWQKWLYCWQKHCGSVGHNSHWGQSRNDVAWGLALEKRNKFADISSWWCPLISTWGTLFCGFPQILWRGLFYPGYMGLLISGHTGLCKVLPDNSLISGGRVVVLNSSPPCCQALAVPGCCDPTKRQTQFSISLMGTKPILQNILRTILSLTWSQNFCRVPSPSF